MKFSGYFGGAILLSIMVLIIGCRKEEVVPEVTLSDDFESGSIGLVQKISDLSWELYLADDNDNAGLPDNWRNWWYLKMEDVKVTDAVAFTLKNRGWPYYYLPVYSYDKKNWHRFQESEVTQNSARELIFVKQFDQPDFWMARFYPYTYTDLKEYLKKIEGNPYVKISTPGLTQKGNSVYLIEVTDFDVPVTGKNRIFIHARTHPAETPPSFVIEGLIDYLLDESPQALAILSQFEFYIFPMQNVDGVIVGNYRTTPMSENLEVMWLFDVLSPLELSDVTPAEVRILHQLAKNLMQDGGPPVSIALNLHASNSEPDIRTFFYPHFGPEQMGYDSHEAALWNKQCAFIGSFASHFGADMIEPLPVEGGSSFATNTYPESWWWANFKDEVMAMTMEMTYGRSGFVPRWIDPNDMRTIGRAIAMGIADYFNPAFTLPFANGSTEKGKMVPLKYPNLYPPAAADENKK